jgi:hypothetical protein
MLLFFQFIGAPIQESLMFIFVIQLLVVFYALADFFLSGFRRKQALTIHELAWSLCIGIAVFFLVDYLALYFNYDLGKYFHKWLFVLSATALYFCFWLKRNGNENNLYKWIISMCHAALIPVWFVLSQEIYMILNQHDVFAGSPLAIFLFFILLTALQIIRSLRKERNAIEPETKAIASIANFYFPWMIAGLIAFTFYRPVVEAPMEMFEQANPALSIQQFYEFGKLPWLQTFSSHSGADFLTGFLYSMLNGFTGLSYHCYDFLVVVLYLVLLYYTVKNLTGNPYLAFFTVLIYPYISLLIPQYHNIMLIPLLILAATLNAPTFKNYFLLFSCLILMPLWRYDLGYGNIVALITSMFIFMLFRKDLRSSLPSLRKGFIYALILPIILFVIALLRNHQSILINIKDAVGYLNSAQAFGIKDLANEKNLVYLALYFIFPLVVAVCFFFALYRFIISARKEEKASFGNVAVIFLSVYYFANFHRGLIRHNLSEGWDTAFTSFAFFILTATVYDFLRTKNKTLQLAAASAFASLIIIHFKYPQPEFSKNNYYSELNSFIRNPVIASIENKKINRATVRSDFAKMEFDDLKQFLDKNIPPDATFLDFSNTPMLYLYLHRVTPNYFNQIPHTALNIYLQQRFLEELKNYKVPVVLFSNCPTQWWDNFDGVPNTYRHYLVAEYIYEHYRPYAIINHHAVWMEKDNKIFTESHPEYIKDTVSGQPKDQYLKYLPYVMGKSWPLVMNDTLSLFKKVSTASYNIDEKTPGLFILSVPVKNDEANYVLVKAKNLSGKRMEAHLGFGNNDQQEGGFSFFLKEDREEHVYLIRLSTQYDWYNGESNNFQLNVTDGKCEVTDISLMKGKL